MRGAVRDSPATDGAPQGLDARVAAAQVQGDHGAAEIAQHPGVARCLRGDEPAQGERAAGAARMAGLVKGVAEDQRSDNARRGGNQHIVTVDIGPVLAARRLRQTALAPVVYPIVRAAIFVRHRVAAAKIVPVPGEMIAVTVAIVMSVAMRVAGETVAIRAMALRPTAAVVVAVAIVTIAVMLLPGLAMMVARAVSPGKGRNQ